ncbi:MAG: response regulator, partial [Candidatus Omnitrophica bacterium]|nr:response regulator [Candidatus Omnitrophota bacterium]
QTKLEIVFDKIISEHIKADLNAYVNGLRDIQNLYMASDFVNRDEFSIFCSNILNQDRYEALCSLQWVKRQGYSKKNTDIAQKEANIFVVEYSEPPFSGADAIGSVFNYNTARNELVRESLASGLFAISSSIEIFKTDKKRREIMIILPVFERGSPRVTLADNLALNMGFIVGFVDLDTFFNKAVSKEISVINASAALFDLVDEHAIQLAGFRITDIAGKEGMHKKKDKLFFKKYIKFGNRKWIFCAESSDRPVIFHSKETYFAPVLLIFLFVTLSFFLSIFIRRSERANTALAKRMKELNESNTKLQELLSLQTKFTTTVSHELKTPLTAIKTALDIVLKDKSLALNGAQKSFLDKARNNTERLTRLISDVLDLSKIESGKSKLRISSVNINDIVKEVMELEQPLIAEQGLYLKGELEENLPPAEVDADKINQVVSNIISNARKFTERGGITVCTRSNTERNYIEVCVEDTGRGLEEKDLNKIFIKFSQLEKGEDVKKGGTGLGLAISKEIITLHRGRIWVESKAGKGSSFYFRVPIIFNKALIGESRKHTILLIDDEMDLADMLKYQLENHNYNVVLAYDGLEALEKLKTINPDLIILDINLPKMGGIEFYSRICSPYGKSKYPVLVMTARTNLEKVFKDIEVDGFIAKPFEIDDFIGEVRKILERSVNPLIHIIDDEEKYHVKNIVEELRKERYEPVCVKNEGMLRTAMQTRAPYCVFMEYAQKDALGAESIRAVRNILDSFSEGAPGGRKIPLVVYSYMGFGEYFDKSLEAGADVCLGKPEKYSEFITVLRDIKERESRAGK